MRLYGYFRSSAAYRVRIALNLKGLAHEAVAVHLLRGGGEQHQPAYRALNPQGLVPSLATDGAVLTQSLAIIEYLEEIRPEPRLLPGTPLDRARIRALALAVAADLHPLNNLRVLAYLRDELGQTQDGVGRWYRHWIATGLAALEAMVAGDRRTGAFCHGDQPTLADICLVPQLANARRFAADLGAYPTLVAIDARCRALPAFQAAAPEAQLDAE
jgi:maleylacetoacetate isomerase